MNVLQRVVSIMYDLPDTVDNEIPELEEDLGFDDDYQDGQFGQD